MCVCVCAYMYASEAGVFLDVALTHPANRGQGRKKKDSINFRKISKILFVLRDSTCLQFFF